MKRNVFLAIISIFSAILPIAAGEYKPLLEDGKSWLMGCSVRVGFYGIPGSRSLMKKYVVYCEYSVDGDVEKEGKLCKRIVAKTEGEDEIFAEYFLHEEDGVVSIYDDYRKSENKDPFTPVLDIRANVGDSILTIPAGDSAWLEEYLQKYPNSRDEFYRIPSAVGTSVGSDGIERREIFFGDESWVEGIGARSQWSWLYSPMAISDGSSRNSYLVECRKDGKTIFTNKDFANPVSLGLETARTITPGKSWTMARGEDVFTIEVDREIVADGIHWRVLKSSEGKEYIVTEESGCLYAFLPQLGKPNSYNGFLVSDLGGLVYRADATTRQFLFDKEIWKRSAINELTVGGRTFSEYLYEYLDEDTDGEVVASWGDGVGAPDSKSWAVVMPEDFQTLRMIDCRQDGEVIFTAEDFTYQSSISEVSADPTVRQGVYDLQGRRVATPGRGLYIINGQKQLLR